MDKRILVVFAFCAMTAAVKDGAREEVKSDSKDELLSKVTRELLILEIEDMKRELKQKQDHLKLPPPVIDTSEQIKERKAAKKDEIKETKTADMKKELTAEVEKEFKARRESKGSTEKQLAKRLIDISQVKATCIDELGEESCLKFQKFAVGFCTWEENLAKKCQKTCGRCGLFDAYPKYCKLLRDKCTEKGIEGKFVREKCRKTCAVSSSISRPCEDDKIQANFCPMWRKMGACKNKEMMEKYCMKTCEFC